MTTDLPLARASESALSTSKEKGKHFRIRLQMLNSEKRINVKIIPTNARHSLSRIFQYALPMINVAGRRSGQFKFFMAFAFPITVDLDPSAIYRVQSR